MPNVNSQFDNCSFVGCFPPLCQGYKADPDEKFRKYPANRSPLLFLDWIQAGLIRGDNVSNEVRIGGQDNGVFRIFSFDRFTDTFSSSIRTG